MKISVIIPSYEQGPYLNDALDSVLSQTGGNEMEIIVVDDGSTDGSLAIAQSYIPFGVKVISQVNKGLPSARNTGIMNATGDYVLPLDADDMLVENAVDKICAAITETDADIIAPSFKCFGKHNDTIIVDGELDLEAFKGANRIPYSSAVRRSVLLEVGGYNPRMTWGWEDYDLWIDLLKRGKTIKTLPDVLMMYRTKDRSMIDVANEHSTELTWQLHFNHPDVFPRHED